MKLAEAIRRARSRMAYRQTSSGVIIRHQNHFYIDASEGREPAVDHAVTKDDNEDWQPLRNNKYVDLRNKLLEFISQAPKDLTTVSRHAEKQLLSELLLEAKQRWARIKVLVDQIEELSITDPTLVELVRQLCEETNDYAEML